jgi:tetratricopeptide (TPR) repeat protein
VLSFLNIDLDLRFFRRYAGDTDFTVVVKDRPFTAKIIDYSLSGLGILIYGLPPLKPGAMLRLDIDSLRIQQDARVIWIKKKESSVRAGLHKIGRLTGSFEHYRFSDILLGLQRTLKTGLFTANKGSVVKEVYIKNGNIVFATSNQDQDRLGDFLLKKRKITKQQYERAAELKEKTGKHYAVILVDLGMLKPSELKSAVELQTKRILRSLFIWKNAHFDFREDPAPLNGVISLKLSVADLIFREVKKTADLKLLKEHLLDNIVDFSKTPLNLFQNIKLTKIDRKIISLIDGKTAIKDIVRLSSDDKSDTLKSIYALLEARIIEISAAGKTPSGISHKEVLEKRRKTSRKLIKQIEGLYALYQNMDYYEVLGLKMPGSDDIKKAYYNAVKEFHPDLHFNLPEDMKSKLLEIYTYITNAYLTLIDPEKRREYNSCMHLNKLPAGVRGKTETAYPFFEKDIEMRVYHKCLHLNQSRVAKNVEIAFSKSQEGKQQFKKRNFKEAAHLFAMAIYFDGTVAEFHFQYGRALAETAKLRDAVKALNRALELRPHSADTLVELGHVYLRLGYPLRAKGYFEKAMKHSPTNKKAKRGLNS